MSHNLCRIGKNDFSADIEKNASLQYASIPLADAEEGSWQILHHSELCKNLCLMNFLNKFALSHAHICDPTQTIMRLFEGDTKTDISNSTYRSTSI